MQKKACNSVPPVQKPCTAWLFAGKMCGKACDLRVSLPCHGTVTLKNTTNPLIMLACPAVSHLSSDNNKTLKFSERICE